MIWREVIGSYAVEIETGGRCRFDVQLTNSLHRHDYHEICLVETGSGSFRHEGEVIPVSRGSAFVALPGVVHEISSLETKDLDLFFINLSLRPISGPIGSPESRVIETFVELPRIHSADCEALLPYISLLSVDSEDALRAQALKLFALELLARLTGGEIQRRDPNIPADLRSAIDLIESHQSERLPVSALASVLGVSERTLRRRFRREFGTTIQEEIAHRRMRQAAHRLLMGFGVSEVAEQFGLDPAQFSRMFKRAFGVPPKRFQAEYQPGSISRQTRPA